MMKLLAFVDLHNEVEYFKKLVLKAELEAVELIVGAGDFSVWGSGLRNVFKGLNKLGKPVLVIHGNHETLEELKNAMKGLENIQCLHHKALVFRTANGEAVTFYGHGGGGFSRESPSLENVFNKAVNALKNKPSVFVTHEPPAFTKLDIIQGEHVGNLTVRRVIEQAMPSLVITGHLHENFLVRDKIKKSVIVNPGPEGLVLEV